MIISPHTKAGQLVLEDPQLGRNFALLSGLPTRKRWEGRKLIFTVNGASIDFLLEHFPMAEWAQGAIEHRQAYQEKQEVAKQASLAKNEALSDIPIKIPFKTVPFGHQLKALELSMDREAFGLFHEQGTGKTKTLLDTAAHLYLSNKIDCLVVVAPNGVHRNWIDTEAPIHCAVPWEGMAFSNHLTKKKQEAFYSLIRHKGSSLIIATFNIEGFVSNKAGEALTHFLKGCRCMLVIDESDTIKNHRAQRTKTMLQAKKHAPFRRIATGTPVTKGVEDLYSQLRFLDDDITGHSSYTAFKAEFCVMGGFEFRQIVGYKNLAKLQDRIDGWTHRVRKADCLDLPEKLYQRLFFDMSGEQRALYDKLKREFTADFEGQTITEDIAMVRLLRLQQIACGWFPGEESTVQIGKSNARFLAMMELLDHIDGQIILWSRFTADIGLMAKEFGRQCVRYDGQVSNDDRSLAIKKFQAGDARYFLGQLKTGARGLTLTAASTVVYYANNFELGLRLQSEDRAHRIGTKGNVVYIDVQANNSIDKRIIDSLRAKKNVADEVMKDPKTFFLEDPE